MADDRTGSEIQDVLKKLDPTLAQQASVHHDASWQQGTPSDEELLYYLTTAKTIRSRLRWEPVELRRARTGPRARLRPRVHCEDGLGKLLSLRGNVTRDDYSLSLMLPARPMYVRLAGFDSTKSIRRGGAIIAGPHAQLWSDDDAEPFHVGHRRVVHCDESECVTDSHPVEAALDRFLRILNISLKFPYQSCLHIPKTRGR